MAPTLFNESVSVAPSILIHIRGSSSGDYRLFCFCHCPIIAAANPVQTKFAAAETVVGGGGRGGGTATVVTAAKVGCLEESFAFLATRCARNLIVFSIYASAYFCIRSLAMCSSLPWHIYRK